MGTGCGQGVCLTISPWQPGQDPWQRYLPQTTSEREINESFRWVLAGRRKAKRRESREGYPRSTVRGGRCQMESKGGDWRHSDVVIWGGRWSKWETGLSCQPHCSLSSPWVYAIGLLLSRGAWELPATLKKTEAKHRGGPPLAVGNRGLGLLDVPIPGWMEQWALLLRAVAGGGLELISVRYFPTWKAKSKVGFFLMPWKPLT